MAQTERIGGEAAGRISYGIDEASSATGVSRSGLYREMAAGRLRFRQCGGRRLITADDLRAWLESLPTGPDAA